VQLAPQRLLAERGLGRAPRGGLAGGRDDPARHRAVDEHERARDGQLDDRAEALEPRAARWMLARGAQAIADRERRVLRAGEEVPHATTVADADQATAMFR
jgi:hypothetical protein